MRHPSILFFDIGGTVFDWETAITEALAASSALDAAEHRSFAWSCRQAFLDESSAVRNGLLPWKEADDLFSGVVAAQLQRRNIRMAPEAATHLKRAWENMPAWPEAVTAIADLRRQHRVVPFSLLSWSMAIGSSRRNGLSWDGLLTCDVLGFYKPDPRCFDKALGLFKAGAGEVLMVASHPSDLYAAKAHGFRTAYIEPRLRDPGEDYGACDPRNDFDYSFGNFEALTSELTKP